MGAQQLMDKIVHSAIEDIATMSDAGQVNNRINQAITALDGVHCISIADMTYLSQSKQALGTAQINLGLGKRDKLLDELLARSKNMTEASEAMDAAAGDTIMHKIAGTGQQVLDVANSVNALGTALKSAVDNPASADKAELSAKAYAAIDAIKGLVANA
jgi:hypothetical protein